MTKKTNTGNSNVVEMKPKSKSDLIKNLQLFLTGDLGGISENLISRVKYAVERPLNKVTAKDLQELCTEVSEAIKKVVRSQKAQKAEAALKPSPKQASSKAPKAAPAAEPEEAEDVSKPSKPAGKAKAAPKAKGGVKIATPLSAKSETPVIMFPETIEDEELGTLVRASGELTTYKELSDYINEEKPLYFATYWNPRQIKEFSYSRNYDVPCPKEFPNDLDLLVALLACENVERVYAMSRYTEAMFSFNGEDLEPVASKTPDGEEYAIRVSNGMEFELYIPAE